MHPDPSGNLSSKVTHTQHGRYLVSLFLGKLRLGHKREYARGKGFYRLL